jgi:hypothetical protein
MSLGSTCVGVCPEITKQFFDRPSPGCFQVGILQPIKSISKYFAQTHFVAQPAKLGTDQTIITLLDTHFVLLVADFIDSFVTMLAMPAILDSKSLKNQCEAAMLSSPGWSYRLDTLRLATTRFSSIF